MRKAANILFGLLIAGMLSTNAFASNETHSSRTLSGEWSKGHTSLTYHLEALQNYEGVTTELKKRLHISETRLAQLANKPHMDPKGLHRFSAKLLSNHFRSEIEKIEQRISWHQEQIRQLQSFS